MTKTNAPRQLIWRSDARREFLREKLERATARLIGIRLRLTMTRHPQDTKEERLKLFEEKADALANFERARAAYANVLASA